jgi:hypothetical protein
MALPTKTFVFPNVDNTDRDADLNPVPNGSSIYNTTEDRLEYTTDNGASWKEIASIDDIPVDTTAFGESFFQGNATETVISVAGTAVKIAGTYSSGDLLKFTESGGTLTYTADESKQFLISLSLTATLDLSTSNISVVIHKNGSELTKSKQTNFTGSVSPGMQSTSVNALTFLDTNDTIEVFIQNDDTTSNITVQDLNVSVSAVGGMVGAGDDQVVTSWDGSTASVAVTGGTGIDITGGVITATGDTGLGDIRRLMTSADPVNNYNGMPYPVTVWNSFSGTNIIQANSFDINDTIEIDVLGRFSINISDTALGNTSIFDVVFGSLFTFSSSNVFPNSTATGSGPFQFKLRLTRIDATNISFSGSGFFWSQIDTFIPINFNSGVIFNYDENISETILVQLNGNFFPGSPSDLFGFQFWSLNINQYKG